MSTAGKALPSVVVIRPQSGYVNRLQAIVSAWLMAEDLGARFCIDWQPSEVTPVELTDVLDSTQCTAFQQSSAQIENELGIDLANIPPYLNFDAKTRVLTLAGLDQGEQFFMPKLRQLLQEKDVRGIVISAGGKFTIEGEGVLSLDEEVNFRRRRRHLYSRLRLHPEVEGKASEITSGREPFIGLHLRYSDRRIDSPWHWLIKQALIDLQKRSEVRNLFVASDNSRAKNSWLKKTRLIGFDSWSATEVNLPRSDPRSAWQALVDWRVLCNSSALMYFAASSFAEEAAVAGGTYDSSVALRASKSRKGWVKAREYAQAAATYPQRRSWW